MAPMFVWDVDDVLNDLMRTWLEEWWKPAHPACTLAYREIVRNPPGEALGAPAEEYFASLDAFRLAPLSSALAPNPEILAWFERYGAGARHMALTARPLASAPAAAEWTFRHFGRWVRDFAFVPSRFAPGEPAWDRTKGDYLEWLGKPGVLIDDSEENVRAARRLGMRATVYPRPWNGGRTSVAETLAGLARLVEP